MFGSSWKPSIRKSIISVEISCFIDFFFFGQVVEIFGSHLEASHLGSFLPVFGLRRKFWVGMRKRHA